MRYLKQSGFALIAVIIVAVSVVLVGGLGFLAYQTLQSDGKEGNSRVDAPDSSDPNAPPLMLKSIGINLDDYDPDTNSAGDIVFTQQKIEGYNDVIFFDYGAVVPANSAAESRMNPQPTFILPLGTKVRSLVDGVVVDIPKLYSNDYSIMVADKKESQWVYETEHVINPIVSVGDTVKAGQVIAEVSTHDSQYHPGFGLYEIGILNAGNPPRHVCPFNYLDESIKDDVFKKLTNFYKSWEDYRGNNDLYDETKHVVPGCYTLDPVEG